MSNLQTRLRAPWLSAPWLSAPWLSAQRLGLLRLLDLGQRLHPRHLKAPHLLTGERGEFEALFFLRRQGYAIVERRWRAPELNGDLDLIGWEGDCLCFIEVKTRTARDLTPASSAIDESKRKILRQMSRAYLRSLPGRAEAKPPARFDVVSVYWMDGKVECELVRGAFLSSPSPGWNDRGQFGV